MNDPEEIAKKVLCFVVGLAVGIVLASYSLTMGWEKKVIYHDAGRYNPTNGNFEWTR